MPRMYDVRKQMFALDSSVFGTVYPARLTKSRSDAWSTLEDVALR
jgi:hypothetical protein